MVTAAQEVIRSDAPDADLLAAAGHTAQLAVREVAGRRAWLPRVLDLLGPDDRAWVRTTVAARREFRSMHPTSSADLADELPAWRIVAPASAAHADAQLPRGGAPLRRGLGVPRRDQPGRDRLRPDPRHVGGRRPGADAVHPDHVGHLRRRRRHRRRARRDPGRGPPAPGQRLRPRQGRGAVALQQLLGLRPRRHAARAGDAARPAAAPRLPRVAGLLPDRGRERLAARGLRPRRPVPVRAYVAAHPERLP